MVVGTTYEGNSRRGSRTTQEEKEEDVEVEAEEEEEEEEEVSSAELLAFEQEMNGNPQLRLPTRRRR